MLKRRLRARKNFWNEREAMAANEWQFVDKVQSAKREDRDRWFRTRCSTVDLSEAYIQVIVNLTL